MPAKPPSQFTFVDLFAGIGGMRTAFEAVGGRCVFSSEWDRFARETYEANYSETPEGDITEIPSDAIAPHDVLLAGFPCQPFRIAGVTKHRALGNDDGFRHKTQGSLFFQVARILDYHRPTAFVLENVKNLLSHDGGRTFRVIESTLRNELQYDLHWEVIDAARAVPQHRERLFMVGFRQRTPFCFPKFEERTTSLRDILEKHVDAKYSLSQHLWAYLQAYAAKHRAKGNGFGYGLVDPDTSDAVTRTLSARYHKDGSEILIPTDGGTPRRLTPRECARLMGFPESFRIPVSDTQAYRQFGNSVVVPIIEAIAKQVMAAICQRIGPTAKPSHGQTSRQLRLLREKQRSQEAYAVGGKRTSPSMNGGQMTVGGTA